MGPPRSPGRNRLIRQLTSGVWPGVGTVLQRQLLLRIPEKSPLGHRDRSSRECCTHRAQEEQHAIVGWRKKREDRSCHRTPQRYSKRGEVTKFLAALSEDEETAEHGARHEAESSPSPDDYRRAFARIDSPRVDDPGDQSNCGENGPPRSSLRDADA